jgi:alpha/beta hydrolase fold
VSLRTELVRFGIRRFVNRKQLRAMEKLTPKPPASTRIAAVAAGRVKVDLITVPASKPRRHVLYFHGGAYRAGSPSNHRHFIWRVAAATEAAVLGSRARFNTAWVRPPECASDIGRPVSRSARASACRQLNLPVAQPDPRRKVTTRPKNCRIRDGRCNRGRPDNTNSGDALQPLARLARAMLNNDSFLDRSDHRGGSFPTLQNCKWHRKTKCLLPRASATEGFFIFVLPC